ncbi:MAG: hypothetical protein HY319_12025 [Armatimonadetes bacterium]|nr:hypothetical protein [Armatimonadota bacterium]
MSVLNSHHHAHAATQTGQAQSAQPPQLTRPTRQVEPAVDDGGVHAGDRASDAAEHGTRVGTPGDVRRRERRWDTSHRRVPERPSRRTEGRRLVDVPSDRRDVEELRQARARRFERGRRQRLSTVDRAFQDNSREIQARFFSQKVADGDTDPINLSPKGKMRQIVSSLMRLCNDQLQQHTGNEPYMKADYRMFMATFQKIQDKGQGDAERDPWELAPASHSSTFRTLFGKAQQVLRIFEPHPGYELEAVA